MPSKKSKRAHEFTRSQISALSIITLAIAVSTFALGYKAGAAQNPSQASEPVSPPLLPHLDEQASLEELIRQIENADSDIRLKDYVFPQEIEAQKLPLGLGSNSELLDKTQIRADENENPPEPEITKLKLPSSGWSVQVGSFPSLEEAEESIAMLSEKNIEAYYIVALINNKNWYRVRVGGYNSKSLAEKGKKNLSAQLGGNDYIIRKAP
ncbi:MAG: SPOR domain-containing protein [Myxococcota bacterium]|nr:SPOR domain-containing protein [Myxococcota bacterium]